MNNHHDSEIQWAGRILIATGLLTIILMLLHPDSWQAGVMIPLVHGSLQAVIVVQVGAMIVGMRSYGWNLWITTGMLFVGAGYLAGTGAATINGFMMPAFLDRVDGEALPQIRQLVWEADQALARLGVIATGIGFVLWAVMLWRHAQRVLAVAGMVAGLIPALLLASGHLNMHLHGAILVYTAQALWVIALGWSFARRKPIAD
ncbi:MAG: hypothetical protein AAGE37_01995 [Pseudomonadota bacterium]